MSVLPQVIHTCKAKSPPDRAGAQWKDHAAEQPLGMDGDRVLLSDATKGYAVMSLYCSCTSWASQGMEKWGKGRVEIYNENRAFDLLG